MRSMTSRATDDASPARAPGEKAADRPGSHGLFSSLTTYCAAGAHNINVSVFLLHFVVVCVGGHPLGLGGF